MSCQNWNAPDKANVDQDNNSVEYLVGSIIRDYTEGKDKRQVYRETCGPSSLEAMLEGLGVDQGKTSPLQPSDFYTMYLNDPARGFPAGWDKPKNRYLEAYPRLIEALYPGLYSEVWYLPDSKQRLTAELRNILAAKDTVAMLLLKDPGHYIAGLHIDDKDIVTYNESWMGNFWNPGKTRKRTIALASLVQNMKYGLLKVVKK